jgi:DNA primase
MIVRMNSLNSKSSLNHNLRQEIVKLFDNHNIQIVNESGEEITTYCLFHQNTNSPAFYINIKTGLWQCFNPSCNKKGNFRQLYRHVTGKSYGKDIALDPIALKLMLEKELGDEDHKDELQIEQIQLDYENGEDKKLLNQFFERGLSYETLEYFEVGYSKLKDRIVIPVRDQQYKLVGFIGRAVYDYQEPRYLYNKGFKRANVLFNIQNAKKYDSCIIVEGSTDAMKVHQSGFPNVVAALGAKMSDNHFAMLRKYFDEIIIFSDNDGAGDEMASAIIVGCQGKRMYRASISDGLKDPGEMTEQQIKEAITNKKTTYI